MMICKCCLNWVLLFVFRQLDFFNENSSSLSLEKINLYYLLNLLFILNIKFSRS